MLGWTPAQTLAAYASTLTPVLIQGEYDRLYEIVKGGGDVLGYVYEMCEEHLQRRSVNIEAPLEIDDFNLVCFGDLTASTRSGNEREAFMSECQRLKLAWVGMGHAAPLEAEVAKLRALVQKIIDLSFHDSECHIIEFGGPCNCLKSVIDAAAKEQGFTPTNTEAPTSEGSTTQ